MTLVVNTAEGGTNGATVTTGNSGGGSGTAFTSVNIGANATLTYDNSQAAHGALSYHCGNNGTINANSAFVFLPGAASTSYATRFYIRFKTLPGTTGQAFMGLQNGGGWRIAGTNQFAIKDQSGAAIKTFTTTIVTDVWYRLELEIVRGVGFGPNGYLAGRIFLGDSTTPLESYSSNVQNTGDTATFPGVDFGVTGPTPFQLYDLWIDDLAIADNTTTPIGPASGPPVDGWGMAMGGTARATATASMTLAASAAAAVTPVAATGTASLTITATAATTQAAATGTASLSLAATGAAAAAITPATVVTPQRVGRPKGTSWGGGSSVTAALPQTPTAGNTLIALVSSYGFASFTATMSTPAGWTAGPARVETGGGTRPALFMFWKLATGSESNPTFNVNANGASSGQVTITEWRGLDTSAPHRADSAGANVAGTGNQSLTDSITTTTVNEWVFTAIGANGVQAFGPNSNGPTIAWDTPQLVWDFPEMANQASAAWASGCYPSAGVKAPHVTFNMSGGVSTNIASMSFKVAAGSRPGMAESAWSEATGPTWTATLQTTPDPADVLICVLVHNDSVGAASISGCGATWTAREVHDSAGNYDMHVWTGVNPTSAGVVTVTTANSVQGKIRVLRASGVGNTVATSYARNSSGAASFTGPTVTAGPGQLVVALQAISGTGSSDAPVASASPPVSNNWMTDTLLKVSNLNGTAQDAWLVPSAPGTSCNVTGTSATTRFFPTTMVVVG